MIQADPTLGPDRLQLLIDSLASGWSALPAFLELPLTPTGVDVFHDPSRSTGVDASKDEERNRIDEVGLILGDE